VSNMDLDDYDGPFVADPEEQDRCECAFCWCSNFVREGGACAQCRSGAHQ
jgi:hypothetical protein